MFASIKESTELLPVIIEIIVDFASTKVYHISDKCFGLEYRHGIEHRHYVQEDCLSEPTLFPTIRLDEIYIENDQKLKRHLRHETKKIEANVDRDDDDKLDQHFTQLLNQNCSAMSKLKLPYHFRTFELSLMETCELVMHISGADCRAVFIDNGPNEVTILYNNPRNLTDLEEQKEDKKRKPLYKDEKFVQNLLSNLDQQILCLLMNFNFMEYYVKKFGSNFIISHIHHYGDRLLQHIENNK
jgi:hypothetical protein